MFKSITISGWENGKHSYILKDSSFTDTVLGYKDVHGSIALETVLIREYSNRKLPVAKNVALLYLSYNSFSMEFAKKYINDDCQLIDATFPELEYGKKYFRCVVNQYEYFKKIKYVY